MSVPLLVGELNPVSDHPEDALYCYPPGCSDERLQRLVLGLRQPTYLALHRANLCVGRWSLTAARTKAEQLTLDEPSRPWDVAVMLGRKVADAFGYDRPFFSAQECGLFWPYVLISLSHPSGLCRAWREPGAFTRARDLLREHCPEVSWGELC